jgi:hypothetical protein
MTVQVEGDAVDGDDDAVSGTGPHVGRQGRVDGDGLAALDVDGHEVALVGVGSAGVALAGASLARVTLAGFGLLTRVAGL